MDQVVVILEWQFSPPGSFEEPINVTRDDYTMIIGDGKVEARIDSAIYDRNPSMRQALHDAVNGRFLGVQLLTHKAYNLSRSTMTRLHPDGRRDISVEAEPGHVVVSGFAPDIRVIDKDGNVVHDSKRDRIEKKKSLAELVSTYLTADGLLTSMLESQSAAVRDPNNELVHIYEIREALSTKFGGERGARSALGISCSDWSRLGQLCNNEPLRQGRHRGKSGSALRDATEAELTEARRIALAMIEAYLRHLDTATRAGLRSDRQR